MTQPMSRRIGGKELLLGGLLALGLASAVARTAPRMEEAVLVFPPERLVLTPSAAGTSVDYRGAFSAGRPGEPALPLVTVFLDAPPATTVEALEVDVLSTRPLGRYLLAGAVADRRPGESLPAPPLAPALATRDGFFPAAVAAFSGRGAMRGRNLVQFQVSPLRWNPESGELELLTRVRLRYRLAAASAEALPRHRIVAETEARFAPGLARVLGAGGVVAAPKVELPPAAPGAWRDGGGPAGPGPYQPTFRPTTDGSPVEYVIVTGEALRAQFETLADWKTEKGVRSVVRTVEWIDQTYPNGVDRAERVRFFIRDAYQNWGTLFVLLGGDTDVIPVRYAHSSLIGGESIPADYYYMCLEGNWNADGDTRFGEAFEDSTNMGDSVDLLPEVYAGRAPVSTPEQAATFAAKTIAYDRDPATGNGYPASILYLAERLFTNIDGALIAEEADAIVPPWFKRVKLYEEYASWPGALPETFQAVVDSIGNGFGIVHHIGHGYRNTMSVGDGVLNNADADALANGARQSVVFAINCSAASIDFNSIGERFVKNPDGGSIAYIGTSRLAFINASRDYQREWFSAVFGPDSLRSLGELSAMARVPFVPFSGYESSYRWTLFTVILLGDPEVGLHTQAVAPLAVSHPATHPLDAGTFTATASSAGSPLAGATVTLWKGAEAWVRGTTNASGVASLPFAPETPGPATLTVTRSGYAVYRAVVTVGPAAGPYLHLEAVLVDDDSTPPSIGDGDGRADAGETVELQVTLRNAGAASASGVAATLAVEDPGGYVTLVTPVVSYGTIAAGGTSSGSGRFLVRMAANAPYAFQPRFTLAIASNQRAFSDVFVLPVRRSYLEHLSHVIDDAAPRGNGNGIVEAGEEIWYSISLRNTGQDTARAVAAGLGVVRAGTLDPEPLVTVSDGSSSFGTIRVGATVTGDRFAFRLDPLIDPAAILLRVSYTDALGPIRSEYLDVVPPQAADSLVTFGAPASILIKWRRPPARDLLGYDIYRSQNPNGPFLKVNPYLGTGSAIYEDGGLAPLTRYYYRIGARDSSFNAGPLSAVVSGSTNPPLALGWPIEVGQQAQSSLQLANVAGGPDYEVFTAADYQYGWHADGTEIVDGDGDPRTSGVFARDGYSPSKAFSATCALGDMDRDGTVEVANVGWTVTQAYLWDAAGALKPGWPQSVLDDFNWPSPLMADIDGDQDLELVVWAAKGGRLFAWHHDGREVIDGDQNPATNGVLFRVPGASFCYSSPAAANLDADPAAEIVFCLNIATNNSGPIYAVNGDGTLVPGWPVATGDLANPSAITASPAIGDLDGDGSNEIVVASERGGGRVHVFRANGTNMPGWPKSVPAVTAQVRTGSPVIADVDGDSHLDVVFPSSDGRLWAWNRNGIALPGFPVVFYTGGGEATQSTPTIGDLDADGRMEILIGDESGRVHAFNHDGTPAAGFPIQLPGEVRGSPILWDIDNDGLIEVGVVCWDANVYIWDLPYPWNPTRIPWPFFRHDVANTGYVRSEVLPVGLADPAPAGSGAPRLAAVHPARPNPFNPRTTLAFDVPGPGQVAVQLTIYDVEGRLVARLLDRRLEPGRHAVDWDGRGVGGRPLAAGVYFYRVEIGDFAASRKLTLVK